MYTLHHTITFQWAGDVLGLQLKLTLTFTVTTVTQITFECFTNCFLVGCFEFTYYTQKYKVLSVFYQVRADFYYVWCRYSRSKMAILEITTKSGPIYAQTT